MQTTRVDDLIETYFPAIVCAEYESPIDALMGLHVPQDEAQDLVAAAWAAGGEPCIVTYVDGGRAVAAIRLPDGRWAACNAFLEYTFTRLSDAERRLSTLIKRGKRGVLGTLRKQSANENAGSR